MLLEEKPTSEQPMLGLVSTDWLTRRLAGVLEMGINLTRAWVHQRNIQEDANILDHLYCFPKTARSLTVFP